MKVYLVGGAVRDQLLGLPVDERDWLVIGATPAEMLEQGYTPVGKDFPVFLHPQTKDEYALARTERKSGHGYQGFAFHAAPDVTIEEDLLRRDLTINAMAMDDDGNLIDPYGGQQDLQQGLLRHVSQAFTEDPVRVLRIARFAARFAAQDFRVADETNALMRNMVDSGELDYLVPERTWAETCKALATDMPSRYFETLRECGALQLLFPEIERLYGVPQPARHHPEVDTGVHTMMVVEQAARLSSEPRVRFAALLHDLGKGLTDSSQWPRHHGHEKSGVRLVKQLCERLRVPNDFRELAVIVAEYHGHYRRVTDELRADTSCRTLGALDAYRRPERFEEFLLACEADLRGRTGFENQPTPHADTFRRLYEVASKVDIGTIVESGANGKEIGEAIEKLRIREIETELGKIRAKES
ncbi:multifunctional CCA addition/repair protein [Solemya elarraichensis gill symbiont]|uniref:Multifunctional CCA protein n=1 Tax=Solemya elarraichensis gill symbiont TaxID=1918949 RepID=A0A1T2L8T3_9GAMM|nr:multifunctional CCA addition/repair protein [Solemya elarraichensis gill symbiont]OOZ41515.1 multifunctional CCA tRNA nucleotidyl transferase/2'3'-cyclic phosphodiesterase/2'nucleotidase/phosphatase [Solemya elarraichensis gill symbiont]